MPRTVTQSAFRVLAVPMFAFGRIATVFFCWTLASCLSLGAIDPGCRTDGPQTPLERIKGSMLGGRTTNYQQTLRSLPVQFCLQHSRRTGGPAMRSLARNRVIWLKGVMCGIVRPRRETPGTWTSADRFTSILVATGDDPVRVRIFGRTRRASSL